MRVSRRQKWNPGYRGIFPRTSSACFAGFPTRDMECGTTHYCQFSAPGSSYPGRVSDAPPHPDPPTNTCDFILSASREHCETHYLDPVDRSRSYLLTSIEMLEEFLQLILGRPTRALLAFHVIAELFQDLSDVSHSVLVNLIAPGRLRDREYSSKVSHIVRCGLRLDISASLAHPPKRVLDQTLTIDLRILYLTQSGQRDRFQNCALSLP